MGVDFEVIIAVGYCINIDQLTPEEKKIIEELDDSNIKFEFQDTYGNLDKNAQLLIYIASTKQILVSYKVGWTPFSFLNNQLYLGASNTLRGGAKKYFAISINCSDSEQNGWSISPPCDNCIKSNQTSEGNINHQCRCTGDGYHLEGNQKLLDYKKQIDDFLIVNQLERLTFNTVNFSQWLFSYYC